MLVKMISGVFALCRQHHSLALLRVAPNEKPQFTRSSSRENWTRGISRSTTTSDYGKTLRAYRFVQFLGYNFMVLPDERVQLFAQSALLARHFVIYYTAYTRWFESREECFHNLQHEKHNV